MSDDSTVDADELMTPEELAAIEAEAALLTPEELADDGPEAAPPRGAQLRLAQVIQLPDKSATAWRKDLRIEWTKVGQVISPSVHNLLCILAGDPKLAGMVAYDELRETVVKVRPIEWASYESVPPSETPNADEWTDVDDTRMVSWLDRVHAVKFSTQAVHGAINTIAERIRINPIRDYLRGLVWDATPRLNSWLHTYLGSRDTAYERAIGPRWMISAVARAMKPGCKADHVMVLEGEQGDGKSLALQILASVPWFTDDDLPIGNKDAAAGLHGSWIHELGEVGKLSAKSLEQVKAFVTRQVDRYRPPYGHRAQSFPRRCVFAGSSNDDQYLTDPTGGRRWWGVKCGARAGEGRRIDIASIRADRDQLWAEAVVRFDQGEAWHVDSTALAALCRDEQEARLILDPWAETVGAWLSSIAAKEKLRSVGYLTTSDVLSLALDIDAERRDRSASMRVGAILRTLGWGRKQQRNDAGRVWGYNPSEALPGVE